MLTVRRLEKILSIFVEFPNSVNFEILLDPAIWSTTLGMGYFIGESLQTPTGEQATEASITTFSLGPIAGLRVKVVFLWPQRFKSLFMFFWEKT